jgi:hypothetical protein
MSEFDVALKKAKLLIEDCQDTNGVAASVLMLRSLIEAIDVTNSACWRGTLLVC